MACTGLVLLAFDQKSNYLSNADDFLGSQHERNYISQIKKTDFTCSNKFSAANWEGRETIRDSS